MATGTHLKLVGDSPTKPYEPIGAFLEYVELQCELEFAHLTAGAGSPLADAIRSRMEVTWTRLTRDERRILTDDPRRDTTRE